MTPKHLGRLLDAHAAALELYAAQWLDDVDVAPADVVQDAFVQLIQQEELPEQPAAWLYRVVRNRAVSVGRSSRRRRHREHGVQRSNPGWFTHDPSVLIDAKTAEETLKELSAEQREVVVARIWGALSFEEIAEVTDTSTSTAHRRYEAGLSELRQRLGVAAEL